MRFLPAAGGATIRGEQYRGFTLIEMAVAMFIITLLLGSVLVPLTTQVEQRQTSDAEKALAEIKEALTGFALANGYLPCPDKSAAAGAGTANDGLEDVDATGVCVDAEGNVPWATLGVASSDPWGNRYRYRVDSSFSQRSPAPTFSLASVSGIDVCGSAGAGCPGRLTTASDGPPAVILSHGKNGYGAVNRDTSAGNPAPTSADEIENADGDATFVSRTVAASGTTAGEFDDIVTWLSKNTLFNRMVAAGKLP